MILVHGSRSLLLSMPSLHVHVMLALLLEELHSTGQLFLKLEYLSVWLLLALTASLQDALQAGELWCHIPLRHLSLLGWINNRLLRFQSSLLWNHGRFLWNQSGLQWHGFWRLNIDGKVVFSLRGGFETFWFQNDRVHRFLFHVHVDFLQIIWRGNLWWALCGLR